MTRVQLQFDLLRPLDDVLMDRIARAHGVYGIEHIKVAPNLQSITVEYDATRMNPSEVEAVLLRAGIPVNPRS
jgi:hypothetical protein